MAEYKKSDDIPIGGILVRKNGKKYIAVSESITSDCSACVFDTKGWEFCYGLLCSANERKDKQYIIFIRRKDLETIL